LEFDKKNSRKGALLRNCLFQPSALHAHYPLSRTLETMYLQPLSTEPAEPQSRRTSHSSRTPSPRSTSQNLHRRRSSTSGHESDHRRPAYDPIDPTNHHDSIDDSYEAVDDSHPNSPAFKRHRIRTRVDPTPCRLCGRSYRYRKPHFQRYHPEWLNSTDFEVERETTSGGPPQPADSRVDAARRQWTAEENGVRGSDSAYSDDGGDLHLPSIGSIVRRLTGQSFGSLEDRERDPSKVTSGTFRAVNQPLGTGAEEERQGDEDDMEGLERRNGKALYIGKRWPFGPSRSIDLGVTPRSSVNGSMMEPGSRKRDLDTMVHASSPKSLYPSASKRYRDSNRYDDIEMEEEHITPVTSSQQIEQRAQWEKLLDAIRRSPELSSGQKNLLIYDLFKEHIRASAREIPASASPAEVGNVGRETPISPTPYRTSPEVKSATLSKVILTAQSPKQHHDNSKTVAVAKSPEVAGHQAADSRDVESRNPDS
jgi:hypothetical protein